MKNAMTFDDIYLSKDTAVKLVLKEIDVMDLEYAFSDNIISSIWGVMGYTVLLAFTLFKTGSLAKSVFAAH